jgi:hypothetical protein
MTERKERREKCQTGEARGKERDLGEILPVVRECAEKGCGDRVTRLVTDWARSIGSNGTTVEECGKRDGTLPKHHKSAWWGVSEPGSKPERSRRARGSFDLLARCGTLFPAASKLQTCRSFNLEAPGAWASPAVTSTTSTTPPKLGKCLSLHPCTPSAGLNIRSPTRRLERVHHPSYCVHWTHTWMQPLESSRITRVIHAFTSGTNKTLCHAQGC